MKFNTAIAAMMSTLNKVADSGKITRKEYEILLRLLNPFAPHMTEEANQAIGGEGLLCQAEWPQYDPEKCKESTVEIVVQVNGKLKSKLSVAAEASKEEILAAAKADQKVLDAVGEKQIIKEICVPGKLVNLVVK
jgi:leucyl-tRNA synthetase